MARIFWKSDTKLQQKNEPTKKVGSQSTFERASDKKVAAIGRKITGHCQTQPPSSLHIAQPVFVVLTVLAPTVQQHLKREIRMLVVHARLQTRLDIVHTDLFHTSVTFCWTHYLLLYYLSPAFVAYCDKPPASSLVTSADSRSPY